MSLHVQRIENARRRRSLAEGWETVQRGLPTPAPADGVQTSHRERVLRDAMWKLTVGSHARWGS